MKALKERKVLRKALCTGLGLLALLLSLTLSPVLLEQEAAQAYTVIYVEFTVKVTGWTVNVRSGPGTNYSIVRQIKPEAYVACDGWTYGTVVNDAWTGQPDARWYKIKGKNEWVASAVVYGNAPGSTPLPPSSGDNFVSPVGAYIQRAWPSRSGWYGGGYGVYNWINNGKYHAGVDVNKVEGDYGAPVYATAAGTVVYSANAGGGWGNVIVIKHSSPVGTVYSLYGHLSVRGVSSGQAVGKGQYIGKIGGTGGWSPHLHFEIKKQSAVNTFGLLGPGYTAQHPNNYGYVDPLSFIDRY